MTENVDMWKKMGHKKQLLSKTLSQISKPNQLFCVFNNFMLKIHEETNWSFTIV